MRMRLTFTLVTSFYACDLKQLGENENRRCSCSSEIGLNRVMSIRRLTPTMGEQLQTKLLRLGELNNNEEKKEILTEIGIVVKTLRSRHAEQINCTFDFGQLFAQLTSNDRGVLEQVCDILKTLFALLDPGEVYHRYPTQLSQLITHQDALVRSLVLEEILSTASHPQKMSSLLADTNLLVAIANRIADDSFEVAKCAMRIMTEVGKSKDGLQIVYKGELLRSLARLLVKNNVISFRVYEVVVDIAISSKEGLEASAQSGFLNSLFEILDSEDMLLQVSALDNLRYLSTTEEGLSYLEQQEVFGKLVQKIAQANENPLSNLLIPGLIKFFGNVAHQWPNDIFSKYPVVASALFEVLESPDHTIVGVALDTLGYIASSAEGKYALQALGKAMPCALKKISEIVQGMPTELRIRGLYALALILDVQKSEQDNRILSLTKSWFDSLDDDPLSMIVGICRQPFPDICEAGFDVLAVVASQAWGQEYMSSQPGLAEFLLERNLESTKACKDGKYEVVSRLSQAKPNIFDASTMQKFKEYVRQGPHFVDMGTEVAIESGM
ncbi:26S proteasome non-ATPase regulatory subunit 5 isoform X1 [Andrena cerasifolii]|uniref:26S proteasome non-ATPase regulatory subunit 5 isoform X1 n=2 Tax=Andrena cerasifolii TaxID=2819439 RepID=UPI0040376808